MLPCPSSVPVVERRDSCRFDKSTHSPFCVLVRSVLTTGHAGTGRGGSGGHRPSQGRPAPDGFPVRPPHPTSRTGIRTCRHSGLTRLDKTFDRTEHFGLLPPCRYQTHFGVYHGGKRVLEGGGRVFLVFDPTLRDRRRVFDSGTRTEDRGSGRREHPTESGIGRLHDSSTIHSVASFGPHGRSDSSSPPDPTSRVRGSGTGGTKTR